MEDGFSAIGVPRHYRYSLQIVDDAVQGWALLDDLLLDSKAWFFFSILSLSLSLAVFEFAEFRLHQVDAVVNLGDSIDRASRARNSSLSALSTVLERQHSKLEKIPVKFVLGTALQTLDEALF